MYNIRYKNSNGNFISNQQMQMLDDYTKVFYENDLPIRELEIRGGDVSLEYVHNWNNQDHQSVLANYPEHIIIEHISYINGYRLDKEYSYDESENLDTHTHTLFDENNNRIAHEMILDDEGGIVHTRYKGYYGLSDTPPASSFGTIYSDDNMIVIGVIFFNDHLNLEGQDSFTLEANQISEFIQITGMSQELAEYYMSPEIEPKFKISNE